jgi:hypothetical protein
MIKTLKRIEVLFIPLIPIFSCSGSSEEIITERIVYDVSIKNTDPNVDWWDNSLPGPYRDKLISRMMEDATSGKVTVFSAIGKRLSIDEIKNIGTETISATFQRADPPYDSYDTIVRQELDLRNITRIRFLEEWRFDNKNHLIEKKILGMAPMTESYDPDGNLRGYEALFWIYEDGKVPFER